MILHSFHLFSWFPMKIHENCRFVCTPAPGHRNSMYYCTILHDLGSSFRWIPVIFMIFMEKHRFSWIHHKIIKSCDFTLSVRKSMIYPEKACGYLWIRLYIVSPTGQAAKGIPSGQETHEFHKFNVFSWFFVNSTDFSIFHDFTDFQCNMLPGAAIVFGQAITVPNWW